MGRPLGHLSFVTDGEGRAIDTARWVLTGLGASESARGVAVRATAALPDVDGLPAGTLAYATGLVLAAAAVLESVSGAPVEASADAVAAQLLLPEVVAASYGAPAPQVSEPLRFGCGAVAADLTPGDAASFERLLATLTPDERRDPETVAARAQEWRLPVLPYRRRPAVDGSHPLAYGVGFGSGTGPRAPAPTPREVALDRLVVADLTSMWAGPLCTWLLASCGAEVVKIEPECRPDGLRALDGTGIHPDGIPSTDGNHSGLFDALNRNKQRAALDLREPSDRRAFDAIVARADLVVDSFSPRVAPNLRIEDRRLRAVNADVVTLSIPAFGPASRQRHWVAYGTGIHAVTGLGEGSGAPRVSYPDPLAGFAAFLVALSVMAGRAHGWAPRHVEVSLESATLPLLRIPRPATARAANWPSKWHPWEPLGRPFRAGRLPPPPFSSATLPVPERPAPRWR